jgi:hypothetical protein
MRFERELVESLQRRADSADIPAFEAGLVQAWIMHGRRRKLTTRWAVVAGCGAIAIAGAVLLGPLRSNGENSPIDDTPTVVDPLANLDAGPPPELPYADGVELNFAGHAADLPERPKSITFGVGPIAVVASSAGIALYDHEARLLDELAVRPIGPPAVSADGNSLVWLEANAEGGVRVVAYDLNNRRPASEVTLPESDAARARLVGVLQDGAVLIADAEGLQVWGSRFDGEHGPPAEPTRVHEPADSVAVDTSYDRVVLRQGSGSAITFSSFLLDGTTLVEPITVQASVASLEDPGQIVGAVGDDVVLHRRNDVAQFALPEGLRVEGITKESAETFLLDVMADDERAWVRCDVNSLACELAARLGPSTLVTDWP